MRQPLPKAGRGRVLADWIAESLREAILNGHFAPGEKIDQDIVAEEFEVSRTPIREALRRLESEGFVEVRPHYGAFITMVSRQSLHELFEVRRLLESEAVRQAAPVIPDCVLDDLEGTLTRSQEQLAVGDIAGHCASDVHIHEMLRSYINNGLLKEMLEGLNNHVSMLRRMGHLQPGQHLEDSSREHRMILQAIRERDAERAATEMGRHLENSAVRLERLFD